MDIDIDQNEIDRGKLISASPSKFALVETFLAPSRSPRSHSVSLSGTKCSKALNLHLSLIVLSQICLRSISGQSQVSLRSVSGQSKVSLRSVPGLS